MEHPVKIDMSYKNALFAALGLHLLLGVLLYIGPSSSRPVLVQAQKSPVNAVSDLDTKEIVHAESIDNQAVEQAVNRLKQERLQQLQAEQLRQKSIAQQAEAVRQKRIQEQQKLKALQEEAQKIAIARKKQILDEQKKLKELAAQKEQETKQLQALKQQQIDLEKKRFEIAKAEEAKKAEVLAKKAAELKAQQVADKAKAVQALAAKQAQQAGEVDKYKALIINAISRRWILPENVDNRLFSKFRIRLAPDGAVLEVTLIQSSGDAILDRSAQAAIYKASPLPVPTDPAVFDVFRDISLTVKPENARA